MSNIPNQSGTGAGAPESDSMRARVQAEAQHAPGAIPATEGVPPRHGAAVGDQHPRSAAEDLADGLDLLRRAARKTLNAADPRVEELAERALVQLRQLDETATREFSTRREHLQKAAEEAGREILGAIERVAKGIEAATNREKRERS